VAHFHNLSIIYVHQGKGRTHYFFFLHAQGAGISIGVPGALAGVALVGVFLYLIGSGINDRQEAAWFREHLANEPNDPDKLPVIDVPEAGGEWDMWNMG
jgi:hypothetical protein